jgi:hypothetical protein
MIPTLQIARMDFPNLVFETMQVEFGSCLSDTSRRIPVKITNSSAVDVMYHWTWEADSLKEDVSSMMSMNMRGGGKVAQAKPNPEQLFDILPIKGGLRPGESETLNFSFFAFPGVRAKSTATCVIEGGPTYSVSYTLRHWLRHYVKVPGHSSGLHLENECNFELMKTCMIISLQAIQELNGMQYSLNSCHVRGRENLCSFTQLSSPCKITFRELCSRDITLDPHPP